MNTEQSLEIKDIYEVWYHPLWQQTWFIVTGIIICLTAFIVVSYWLYQRQKKEIVLEPWETALDAFGYLKKSEWESPKLFYIQLTGILKPYLQVRYTLQLVGTTDNEMLELLKKSNRVPAEVTQTIKELLHGVVLIKFANQKAAEKQMQEALNTSISLIKKTIEKK